MKKKIAVVLSLVMAIGVLSASPVSFTQTTVNAAEQTQFSNPVYDEATDTTKWDYVYYGSYPTTEVTGSDLTDAIKNADYNDDEEAVVDGVKYFRMTERDATANKIGNGALRGLTYTKSAFYQWANSKEYHYFKYEPIRWRVLEVKDGNLLLMADNAIDCQRYSTNCEKYTWSDSPMRMWLNGHSEKAANGATFAGDGFFQNAFTKSEQADVKLTKLHTNDNNLWGGLVPGGKDVYDYVFLLTIEDTINSNYGFAGDAMTLSSTRRVEPTDYAYAMGTWLGTYNDYYGSCWWMLRTSGDYAQKMALVYRTGQVYKEGYYNDTAYYGVVPAMYVDASSKNIITEEEYNKTNPSKRNGMVELAKADAKAEAEEAAGKIVYGDANGDGNVDLTDTLIVLKISLGIDEIKDDAERKILDVSGDGIVDLTDTLMILKKSLGLIDKFNVEASTTALEVATYPASGRVWYAADSIAAQHNNDTNLAASSLTVKTRDTLGWGVTFNNFFKDGNYRRFEDGEVIDTQFAKNTTDSAVVINNTALSSRSSKSFTAERNYEALSSQIGQGDYLMISFGHNDEYPQVERYTDPYGASTTEGSYKWYLKTKYIDPALEAGAKPVLISSVVKRNYVDGVYQPQFHEAYAVAMKELSEEYAAQGINIPFIDLHHKMDALYKTLTDEQSKLLHASYDVAEFNDEGQTKIIELLIGPKTEGQLDKDREAEAIAKIKTLSISEVNELVEKAAAETNSKGVSYINKETSGSHMDDVHFTYAGVKYATKYILEGLKEVNADLYNFVDEEAVKELENIELVDTFKESALYKNVH